jgi:hypothetical protein
MDFAKIFDKVPHQRLLYKLKFYGIKNETLNWISAFLSNRTQTFAALYFSPFLYAGATFACFQSDGMQPV